MKKLLASIVILLGGYSLMYAQDGLNQPMTKAVMKVYDNLLKEDPTDYETYFRRANEYYKHNVYTRALNDINNALKYMPATDSDNRFQALLLRANIYINLDMKDEALIDLTEILNIDSNSYIALYMKANIEYEMGKYTEAKSGYQRMQRLNNRSQEALIGLARVAVKENNIGLANEYIDNAVALTPSQSDIYVRRASVRMMMNNAVGAVDDLILALSTDKDNTKALQELVKIGNTNYSAVMTGLSNAIRQAPKVGMFYYIRAVIAQAHFSYIAAIADFEKIISENLYNYHGLYCSLAECYYALGKYEEALSNIDMAMAATVGNAQYYMVKAKILRVKDNDKAMKYIDESLAINPDSPEALGEKGLILTDKGNYKEATANFGYAQLQDAESPINYFRRAWVLGEKMNQQSNANGFYNYVLTLEFDENDVKSLKGFALLFTGKTEEANKWMESILNRTIGDNGLSHYYGACFYAQSGDSDKAFACMKTALDNGYANYHQWHNDTDALINVAPLRKDARFSTLLSQYNHLFENTTIR